MRRRGAILLLLLAAAVTAACGTRSDRYGSTSAMPASGVAPWFKVDFDPTQELIQPYIILAEPGEVLTEPYYLIVEGEHLLWYEAVAYDPDTDEVRESAIFFAVSDTGAEWEIVGEAPVLSAESAWEGYGVGAPSVMFRDGRFLMWYAAGEGTGIGYAESADGVIWEKRAVPVLAPDQQWEGGAAGLVTSPDVLYHHGAFRMLYAGGLPDDCPCLGRRRGRAIGYAISEDGIHWTKVGADGSTNSAKVTPILTPDQAWEGFDAATGARGAVTSPHWRVDRPVQNPIFRLYYSGNLRGQPTLVDVSIGFAGSFDGKVWEKLTPPVNPIIDEIFALTLYGVSEYLFYGEEAPCVVKINNSYRMVFGQHDLLNSRNGIAMAVHPKKDSF